MNRTRGRPVDAGYRGVVHGIALTDLLQMLHLARASVRVRVEPESVGPGAGAIVLREGEIIHAEAGALAGREALGALLGAASGRFQTEDPPPSPRRTVDTPFQLLLLDLAREADEAAAERESSWSEGLELVAAGGGIFEASSTVERRGESELGEAEPSPCQRSRRRWGCRAAALWGAATGVLLAGLIAGLEWIGGKSAPAKTRVAQLALAETRSKTPAEKSSPDSAPSQQSALVPEDPPGQRTLPGDSTLARAAEPTVVSSVIREREVLRVPVATRRPLARRRRRRIPRALPQAPPGPKPAAQRPKTDLIDPWSRSPSRLRQ